MKTISILAVCVLLTGCDYSVPLVKEPATPIDRGLIGLWERAQDNEKPDRLLVLPLNAREYLVAFPAGSADGMYARATLAPVAGLKLVQIEWVGTTRGNVADTNRVFQYATYSLAGDMLEVSLLDGEAVPQEIATTQELVQRLDKEQKSPDLFRKPMRFRNVKQ